MQQNRRTPASRIAFGGVMAALAVTVMSLGGLIPIATYTSPMIACVILNFVIAACGKRIAWAWYGAVAILGVLLSPDKEAAAVFVFLGYYPIVKPWFDRGRLAWVKKAVYFNACVCLMYFLLLRIFGMEQLNEEFAEFGRWMLFVLLALGNVTFFLLDRLLGMKKLEFRRR